MAATTARTRATLAERFFDLYPDEAVAHLETCDAPEIAAHLSGAGPIRAADFLSRLRLDVAGEVAEAMEEEKLVALLPRVDRSRAAALIPWLDRGRRDRVLGAIQPALARELAELSQYPADSAGAIMDPVVTLLRPSSTVREAVARVRRQGHKGITRILVVDEEGKLAGTVPLHELVLAQPTALLATMMEPVPAEVPVTASQEEISEALEHHRQGGLPVVAFDGRLLGVIRQDALVRAAESAATADIQTMVGASRHERALSPVSFAVRKRLPWLQINLGTAFLAAFVVGLFQDTIARFTALAVLLPVAAGQSGNTGAQALAVTMRGLALREIRSRQWFRVASKELVVGALNGIAVALVSGAAVYLWSGSVGLSGVIAVAMITSMVIASIAGASVPIILTMVGQDPAAASSIILTTVTDIVGFLSFLGLATLASAFL